MTSFPVLRKLAVRTMTLGLDRSRSIMVFGLQDHIENRRLRTQEEVEEEKLVDLLQTLGMRKAGNIL